ncbi:MAG: hemolysin III family protein [Firmicutes bacterium]|jgi:hemolysin III|nr:hemolysin III family protein [Bacillota bacterium]
MENQKNKKFQIKEPINAFTHFLGFLMSIPIMITLTMKAYQNASLLSVIAFLIFGISLLLLYGASTIYHTLNISQKGTALLRRIDHMMIFVLIAGTYTPVCLIPLRGKWGWTLFIAVWGFAFAGILLKIFWLNAPRWFSTLLYVVMGWLVLVAFVPLERAIPIGGIVLLASGGIVYTIGAVIYAVKWSKLKLKYFGFHEIFHLFVMGGSALHVLFMFQYVL